MAVVIDFHGRSILSAALAEMGGTQPIFANVLEDGLFRMRVSFDVPDAGNVGVMRSLATLGEEAESLAGAEESACAAACRVLWQDHRYIVLDYSICRTWCCIERRRGLLEKLQISKSIFEDVLNKSLEVFGSIVSAGPFLVGGVGNLRRAGADASTIHAASLCVGFLQMMGVRANAIGEEVTEQLEALVNHEDVAVLLEDAGLAVPNNNDGYVKINGGMLILNRVSNVMGYDSPLSRIETRGDRHKCYFDFPAAGNGGSRELRTFGRVSDSVAKATESAIYNSLLAFSVNQNVEIRDPNRNAYLFAKGKVVEVASDVEHLGNSGSSICSYFDSTRRGLQLMISSFSEKLRGHPAGKEVAGKLDSLLMEVDQCLTTITGPVRTLNENLVVALLPF